jgi:hypothetical protein
MNAAALQNAKIAALASLIKKLEDEAANALRKKNAAAKRAVARTRAK